MFAAVTYGAAQGLFPIGWVVFTAVLLYRITQETGKFEIIKDSIGSLSSDPRLQALLIAFAFGAFIEGASGFGTPIAVAAAMLTGLGFSPFYAAAICLLANTCPVAFGSIGIPITTLAQVTGLPEMRLSAGVGRICAPLSLFVPSYLIAVMGGMKALKGVLLACYRVRHQLRRRSVCHFEFRGRAVDRHSRVAHRHGLSRDAVQGMEAEGPVRDGGGKEPCRAGCSSYTPSRG